MTNLCAGCFPLSTVPFPEKVVATAAESPTADRNAPAHPTGAAECGGGTKCAESRRPGRASSKAALLRRGLQKGGNAKRRHPQKTPPCPAQGEHSGGPREQKGTQRGLPAQPPAVRVFR